MKREKIALVLAICTSISMISAACSSSKESLTTYKKGSGSDQEVISDMNQGSESSDENSAINNPGDPLPMTVPVAFKDVEVGDEITFGSYEQDNDTGNGTEAIEWIVVTIEDGRALLLSKYALDQKPYHSAGGDVTWEDSEIREWMNSDFYEAAFNETEQASILEVELETKEPGYSRMITTTDKVFLLCLSDIGKYFEMDYWDETYQVCDDCFELMTPGTPYAEANGVYNMKISEKTSGQTVADHPELNGAVTCSWWLRETGAFFDFTGSTIGNYRWEPGDVLTPHWHPCDFSDCGVRPAIWIAVDTSAD